MRFIVTILGSCAALPTAQKHHSAHALNVHEQFYLVDCGEGTQNQLMRYGINPLKINAIFISHLHGDHVYGLFGLMSTLGLLGRRQPLQIYAPKPLDEILDNHFKYFDTNLPYQVCFHEVDTRKHCLIFENRTLEVYSIPLRHRIPTTGYLFREKTPALNIHKQAIKQYGLGIAQIAAAKRGENITIECEGTETIIANKELTYLPYKPRSYAYCSDTQRSAKVASIIKEVDLLYHEATFSHQDRKLAAQTGHSTTMDAAKVALKANAKKLIIGHCSQRYKDVSLLVDEARSIFANTFEAKEGDQFELKNQ